MSHIYNFPLVKNSHHPLLTSLTNLLILAISNTCLPMYLKSGLKLFHLNVHNIPLKIVQLRYMSETVSVHILSVNETLFIDQDINITGFSVF